MQKKWFLHILQKYTIANFYIEKYTEAGVKPIQIQPPNEEVLNSLMAERFSASTGTNNTWHINGNPVSRIQWWNIYTMWSKIAQQR